MKKSVFGFVAVLFCSVAFSQTINIDWKVGRTTYATNTCEYGGTLTVPSTPPTKYGYTFQGWLPYTPIEYLESTGTQYVDTGYLSTDATFYTEVMPLKNRINSGIIGYNYSNGGHRMSFAFNGSGLLLLGYGDGGNNYRNVGDSLVPLNQKTQIKINFAGNTVSLRINDSLVSVENNATRSSPISIYVNGVNQQNYATGFKGRFFSAKIWDSGDVLVRDFIPVLDRSGTPCMYDKVNNQFYYNAGTDDFIAGPVIE